MSTAPPLPDLTPTAARIMGTMPPYYLTDPTLRRILNAFAHEVDRADAFLTNIQRGLVPTLADDTLGMLSLWEGILKLPVAPAGVSVSQRQAAVAAALLARRCRTTKQWVAALNAGTGVTGWSYKVGQPSPGFVSFTMPVAEGSYLDGVVRRLARRITPAPYQITFIYAGGFIVGVSRVGDAI